MKVYKDRYTIGFTGIGIGATAGFLGLIFFFFNKTKTASGFFIGMGIIILLCGLLIGISMKVGGRLHASEGYEGEVLIKEEEGCEFKKWNRKTAKVDGIALKRNDTWKRFKAVDGTDWYITKHGELKPCGPGSAFMNCIGRGGWEPQKIQNDKCWKINET